MNRYIKLVNFELNRFIKLYFVLIGLTIIMQFTGVITLSKKYLSRANDAMQSNGLTPEMFVEQHGAMSFDSILYSGWFVGAIALGIVALLFYMFLIWYRDWVGKNTFIYRLLMIPTERINIYFAKATTIFLMVLGLIAIQIILVPLENGLLKYLVPIELRIDLTLNQIINSFNYFMVLIPGTFFNFIAHYLLGFIAVFVVFTAILFERSFGIKGIILGVLYSILAYLIVIMPVIVTGIRGKLFLYPGEYFALEVVLCLIVLTASILISRFLLNKKITV